MLELVYLNNIFQNGIEGSWQNLSYIPPKINSEEKKHTIYPLALYPYLLWVVLPFLQQKRPQPKPASILKGYEKSQEGGLEK